MESHKFILQYILSPQTIGAILPSSKYLAEKMLKSVNFNTARYIIEYGPGTGVFTDKILKYKKNNTLLLLIEKNEGFYQLLKAKYKNAENIIIINDTAENIDQYIKPYGIANVDYIVSGLPFASLPSHVSNTILDKTRDLLHTKGEFITFQYTLFKKGLIGRYFKNIKVKREYRNLPPAYILTCNKD